MIDTIKNLLEYFYIVLKYINKTVNVFTQKINVSLINILKIIKIYRATPYIQPQHPSRDNRPCEPWVFPLKSVLNSVPTLKIVHNATLAAALCMLRSVGLDKNCDRQHDDAWNDLFYSFLCTNFGEVCSLQAWILITVEDTLILGPIPIYSFLVLHLIAVFVFY